MSREPAPTLTERAGHTVRAVHDVAASAIHWTAEHVVPHHNGTADGSQNGTPVDEAQRFDSGLDLYADSES